MAKEIERKFRVYNVPKDIIILNKWEINQGYIAIGSDNSELRIRKSGNAFYLTYKSGNGVVRNEFEAPISELFFNELWPRTLGKRIEKERFEIRYPNGNIELDIFRNREDNLIIAEIEFQSEIECSNFVPPAWFGEEVTDDSRYRNQNLAR